MQGALLLYIELFDQVTCRICTVTRAAMETEDCTAGSILLCKEVGVLVTV